jgi:hypothetical protein
MLPPARSEDRACVPEHPTPVNHSMALQVRRDGLSARTKSRFLPHRTHDLTSSAQQPTEVESHEVCVSESVLMQCL